MARMVVAITRMVRTRLGLGCNLRIELGNIGIGIRFDLCDARRAANENLATIDHRRLHRRINRFAHDGTSCLGCGQVRLNFVPMLRINLFADATFAAKKSDFFFTDFNFDRRAHRAKFCPSDWTDALSCGMKLITVGLTFSSHKRNVAGVNFLQRGDCVGLNLFDARRAANENLLTVDNGRFHVGSDRLAHDRTGPLGFGNVGLDGLPVVGVELLALAAVATKVGNLLADLDFERFTHRAECLTSNRANFLHGNLQVICLRQSRLRRWCVLVLMALVAWLGLCLGNCNGGK